MRRLNNSSRGIDRTTDVLSFPQQEGKVLERRMRQGRERGKKAMVAAPCPPALLGDVVINLHAAQRQASRYGNTFQEEVRRLLIHGLLHLLGYDHERSDYEERKMRKKEINLHHALKTMDKKR
ncbi:MAG TPA: rRNA maturation RNase YbeY [Thermodesulfovibrionales bacterium]|nr:rRNA maturation RNase YbeY [Thermodesulfovibrionales bacterium]